MIDSLPTLPQEVTLGYGGVQNCGIYTEAPLEQEYIYLHMPPLPNSAKATEHQRQYTSHPMNLYLDKHGSISSKYPQSNH